MSEIANVTKLNIVITDDQPLFCEGLSKLVSSWPQSGKVTEAHGGHALLELLKVSRWDIVILDVDMPEMNGVETLKVIRELYPDQKVLILTQIEDEVTLKELIRLGISGFILKNIRFSELSKALDMIAEGSEYFTSLITSILYKLLLNQEEATKKIIELNDREIEILKCTCMQLSVEETAEKLFLSVSSVKKYKMSLLDKTGSKNTVGLVRFALKQGIVKLADI
jgi:DNA-binding NarL/FixJ family response regulator